MRPTPKLKALVQKTESKPENRKTTLGKIRRLFK